MALTTVAAALKILESARNALEAVRERSQASKDVTLKSLVGELYDEFNSLRSIIGRLTEENEELRRAQVEKPPKPEIRQVGETNYYFIGDQGPYCQPCYDRDNKPVALTPQQSLHGNIYRECRVCGESFYEVYSSPKSHRRKPYNPFH